MIRRPANLPAAVLLAAVSAFAIAGCDDRPPPPGSDAVLARTAAELAAVDDLHRALDPADAPRLADLARRSASTEVRQRAMLAHTDVLARNGLADDARRLLVDELRSGALDHRLITTALAGLDQLEAARHGEASGLLDAWIEGRVARGSRVALFVQGTSPIDVREARLGVSRIEAIPGGEEAPEGIVATGRAGWRFGMDAGQTVTVSVPLVIEEEGLHRIEVMLRLDVDEYDVRRYTDEVWIDVGPRGNEVHSVRRLVGDADGDRVPDGLDRCVGTRRGVHVDADGCSPAQLARAPDADDDGLPDAVEVALGGSSRGEVRLGAGLSGRGQVHAARLADGRHLLRAGAARWLFDADARARDPVRGLELDLLDDRETAVGVWGMPEDRSNVTLDVPVGSGSVVCIEAGERATIASATRSGCPLSTTRDPCGDGVRVGARLPRLGGFVRLPGLDERGRCVVDRTLIVRTSDHAVRVEGLSNGVAAVVP